MIFTHTLDIDADIQVVWQLTERVEDWPSFTPTMSWVELLDVAPIRLGSRARVKQPGGPAAVWIVTRLDPPRCFAWRRSVMRADMTATHDLESDSTGCQNTLTVELHGGGSGILGRLVDAKIKRAIAEENHAFKARAEAARGGSAPTSQ